MSRASLAVACVAALATACGARTTLDATRDRDADPPPECVVAAQCDGAADRCHPVACVQNRCVVAPDVDCDDGSVCTDDACIPATGACTHTPVTLDLDGDGHRAPLPGHRAGDPGSCGDDCDDTNAGAAPGGREACDGVDNDCNGVVDDGATFVPGGAGALRVSGAIAPASPGGLAWNGATYRAVYTGSTAGKSSLYTAGLDRSGRAVAPEAKLTKAVSDSEGGPIVWTGDRYGVAFSDRRDGNYEIYFATADEQGALLGPETRVSSGAGFSIGPALAWTGGQFVVAWQDDRGGSFQILAQRISLEGAPVGATVALTKSPLSGHESPAIAAGLGGVAIAYVRGGADVHDVVLTTYDDALVARGAPVVLTDATTGSGVAPTIAWNRDAYVVAWYDPTAAPFAIRGAVVDAKGTLVTPPRTLVAGTAHSRYPSLLPLGDRVLLVFSDDRDGQGGYELYTKMLDAKLEALGPEERITTASGESVFPVATFGPAGDVGVLFRDDRDGEPDVWFTNLVCRTAL